jgi:MSHA biogenesis protein MshK
MAQPLPGGYATDEAPTLHDPMRPPTAAVAPAGRRQGAVTAAVGGYQLSAIRITPELRSAIINGTTVSVGERLGTATVSAIHASHVTLQQAGRTITISLLPFSIKKPVEALQP